MGRTAFVRTMLLGSLMASSVACDYQLDWSNAFGPSPVSIDAIATVYDDGEFLPPGSGSRRPLPGVRLEKAGFGTVTARLGGISRNEKLVTIVLDPS